MRGAADSAARIDRAGAGGRTLEFRRAYQKPRVTPNSGTYGPDQDFDFLFEVLPRLCCEIGPDGRIVRSNATARAILGYERSEFVGRRLLEFIHPDDRGISQERITYCLEHPGETVEWSHRKLSREGDLLAVRTVGRGMGNGVKARTVILVDEETSAWEDAQQRLSTCQECLRGTVSQLAHSDDRQRRRMADELHGLVGGSLAVARMKLGGIGSSAPPALAARVEEIRGQLQQVIETTRSLTFQVGHPILYQVGLGAALEDLARRTARAHDWQLEIDLAAEAVEISESLSITLYQIAQGLVDNIARHARATRVRLASGRFGDLLLLRVSDDGIGFDPESIAEPSSREESPMGLLLMRERLAAVGGTMVVDSSPGQGTRVSIRVPVRSPNGARRGRE